MSNEPTETRIVFGLDYDSFKLATPDYSEDEDVFIECEICKDPITVDELTTVLFRGKEIQCCGYCKENVLTGEIK